MENNDKNNKKPDEGSISENDEKGNLNGDKSERDDSDVKTQIFPQQTTSEQEQSDISDRIESVDLAIEEKFKHLEKPKKSDNRILVGILLVAAVLIVALLVFQKDRSLIDPVFTERPPDNQLEDGTDTEQNAPLDTETPGTEKKAEIKTVELSGDIFVGQSPVQVKETGALFSVEKDSELAAIADALLLRVTLIYGTKIGRKKEITREISSGSFQNFKITGIRSKQMDNILAEGVSIKTPSGGTFFVKDGVLDSVKKTDYEQIQKDLKQSGILISKKVLPEEGVVKVQLVVGSPPEKGSKGEFLIGPLNVGEILLEMPISEMKQVLKGKYRMIKRNIMVEGKYFSVYKVEDMKKSPLYFVYEQNQRIWGIQIVDSRFMTQKRIGINSSLASIRALYSKVKVNQHPKNVTFLTLDDLEIKFFIQDENIDFELKRFPLQTKVSYIILGKSPYLDK